MDNPYYWRQIILNHFSKELLLHILTIILSDKIMKSHLHHNQH